MVKGYFRVKSIETKESDKEVRRRKRQVGEDKEGQCYRNTIGSRDTRGGVEFRAERIK